MDETTSDFGCAVCLLEAGLSKATDGDLALADSIESSAQLGVYAIARRDDGTLWELGRGAMGVTYRAVDTALDRPVALKIIQGSLGATSSSEARERFVREARAAAAFRHLNVATVYQFGICEESGQCFYAMELVEGETLDDRVRRCGPLDLETTLHVALQVTAALAAAERQGLVHRDLKPSNIMMAGDEKAAPVVKVIDFGVAKAITRGADAMGLTHGGFVGTPAFASPEQFAHTPADVRSDIYSLGATLWFLLTGQMPFQGRTVEELRAARRTSSLPLEQLRAARVPRSVVSLLGSMLSLEPAARPGVETLREALQRCREQAAPRARRRRIALSVVALASAALAVFALNIFRPKPRAASAAEPKSIAVLPFEDSSDDNSNDHFASGLHDELLVDLAKIADLKVIARSSVQPYRDATRNVREIGAILGVRTLLQGKVQRAGNRARINVQLIEASSEAQIWAESFEREMSDVFKVQTELALRIAAALKTELSPAERAAIETLPTQDAEAYDLYLRAREAMYSMATRSDTAADAKNATDLLKQAITRDPTFALAHAFLAQLYLGDFRLRHQPTDLERARTCIDTALRLVPDLGEAHMARGLYFYYGLRDFIPAQAEFAIARRALPNNAECLHWSGLLERRLGHWKEALGYQSKAASLDPRDGMIQNDLLSTQRILRHWAEAERTIARVIIVSPQQTNVFRMKQAELALLQGDRAACRAGLQALPPDFDLNGYVSFLRGRLALYDRDYAQAAQILEQTREKLGPSSEWWVARDQAFLARAEGDPFKAKIAWENARRVWETALRDKPEDCILLAMIATADAALGRGDAAMSGIEKAAQQRPIETDPVDGPVLAGYQALVYTWCGEHGRALEQLARLTKSPGGPDPGGLKLDPKWDDLRGDPRFAQIIADASQPLKID